MQKIVWSLGLLILGVLCAMFLVFQPLFTDGPSSLFAGQRIASYAITMAGFAVASFVAARFSGLGLVAVAWLGGPAILVLLVYGDATIVLKALVAASSLIGLGAGTMLGRRFLAARRE